MKKLNLQEIDTVFISYDEPNAEKNYAELVKIIPWAKRIHGVKGSDAAHKAAANLSDTYRFITVDADNIVDPKFFQQKLDISGAKEHFVFSWCGRNAVNGLVYGNGGLKCWTKDFVLNMKTHENADPNDTESVVEFCFDPRYYQMNDCFSVSHINGSPFQAWRAGFREGVKMSLDRGARAEDIKKVWWQNYQRLLIWANIGADTTNGLWAMYGTRLGCYMTNCTDWDYVNVRDFEYLTNFWKEKIQPTIADDDIEKETVIIGKKLKDYLDIEIADLDANASAFFKKVYQNTPRTYTNVISKNV
jgi:hypothetical protein